MTTANETAQEKQTRLRSESINERTAAREKMRADISKLLTEQGVDHAWPEQDDSQLYAKNWITIEGANVGIEMDRTRGGPFYTGLRKLVIRMGGYRQRKNYPRRKDGTFNIAKVVESLKAQAEDNKRGREITKARQEAQIRADTARREFVTETGLDSWNVGVKSRSASEPILTIKLELTPDRMREALRRLGDLAPKN